MQVVRVTAFGGPDVLAMRDVPVPAAGDGEALIAVEAIGTGHVDVMARGGNYARMPEPGFVPGIEIAGRVVGVGEGVPHDWAGRRVFAPLLAGGGYAEQVAVPASALCRLPDGLSASDAVGLGINALVARLAIERAGVQAGERVFVRGAGGGIGLMAVQAAAAAGAIVTATGSSDERSAQLRALGAIDVVGRDEVADAGYDLVIDTVGGPAMSDAIGRLNGNGRYVLCGGVSGAPKPDFGMRLLDIFHRSPAFFAFSLNSLGEADLVAAAERVFADVGRGAIRAVVAGEMPLAAAKEAHCRLEGGGLFGKLVLRP